MQIACAPCTQQIRQGARVTLRGVTDDDPRSRQPCVREER